MHPRMALLCVAVALPTGQEEKKKGCLLFCKGFKNLLLMSNTHALLLETVSGHNNVTGLHLV